MTNLYNIIIAKLTNLFQTVNNENELEPTYEQYIARVQKAEGPICTARRTPRKIDTVPVAAPSTRLVVPNRTVKGQVVDTVLFNLTGGEYGVLDILEDDAAALILA